MSYGMCKKYITGPMWLCLYCRIISSWLMVAHLLRWVNTAGRTWLANACALLISDKLNQRSVTCSKTGSLATPSLQTLCPFSRFMLTKIDSTWLRACIELSKPLSRKKNRTAEARGNCIKSLPTSYMLTKYFSFSQKGRSRSYISRCWNFPLRNNLTFSIN
jgi:hypothetical protein